MAHEIKDIELASKGRLRIEWAEESMPVLRSLRERFEEEKPLKDIRIAACLHVTTETASLVRTLVAGGAEVSLCAANPLSIQDDVAAALVKDYGVSCYAVHGEDNETFYKHINSALEIRPHITMDDGAELITMLHHERTEFLPELIGGTEETSTGVARIQSMSGEGVLKYPVVAVNDSDTMHLFDNRYGTGQSTIDGILRSTNRLLAGSFFVIAGYGWCGKGLAARAKGMGANVIIVEVDAIKALEAFMDGFRVMTMEEAAAVGQFFVTITGNINIIRAEHIEKMQDGAVICNAGHYDVEIDLGALEKMAESKRVIRDSVTEYRMQDGRRLNLLAEGRLVNLSAAEGHAASVMDMSFANQAMSVEFLVADGEGLDARIFKVPSYLDETIARLKLEAMGINIDYLTSEQKKYVDSWASEA